jgi:hypothetical protein
MDGFKHLVDTLSKPTILVTFTFAIFFFIFPPTDWFEKWHRRLKFDRLWSNKSLLIITGILVGFFVFGLTDSDFRAIMLKPDNVPISGLIFLVFFFTWLIESQVKKNTKKINPDIGTLSGLSMMALKSESVNPKTKKPTRIPVIINKDLLLQSRSNFNRRCHFSNQSVGGKMKKKMAKVNVTRIVGLESVSTKCLNPSIYLHRSGNSTIFTNSPKVNSHKYHNNKWQSNTMKYVEAK